nr:mucin-2-like isoform X1 [Danio rerio]|eukprot:XP_021326445.1 mucin-2-like isoform X1 [Danio rerio]
MDMVFIVRMSQMWMVRWVVLLVGLQSVQADFMSDYGDEVNLRVTDQMTVFPGMANVIVTEAVPNPDHQSTICSTWGNFHFKTFDGHFFQLPDTCSYVLVKMCNSPVSDFNIEIQRQIVNNSITFGKITINLEGTVIVLTNNDIIMGDQVVYDSTYKDGITIELSPNVKISNKHGVSVFWEKDRSFLIELSEKYKEKTCGLCGNFNGDKSDDAFKNEYDLATWKESSSESCGHIEMQLNGQCENQTSLCQQYLSSPGFSGCYDVMDMSSFEKACESDLCQCYGNHDCLCNTLTEISQQCTHAGGQPGTWRTKQLCPKTCPLNLLYLECGGPCKSTCSAPTADLMCTDHCVDGCFCPEGMVEDDIGQSGCVPVNKCPCVHNNKTYFSGDSYTQACKTCTCDAGHWTCSYLDCPGICSVVGGSHVTTYDGKTFTFSGNCDYILTKHSNDSDFAVVGNLAPCNPDRTDICLNSVALVILGITISFSSNGDVTLNGNSPFNLPAIIGPVSIFQPSSSFVIADLHSIRLEIQLAPIMQLYIVASTEEKGKMTGLCGNYNDVQKDDFKTESGIIEGTSTTFVNYWIKNNVQYSCTDVKDTFTENPCSLRIETEKLAKDWCSRLTNQSGVFSACHSEICPDIYYQWCVYDTCKCADIRQCMCAALSTYAHACAARGIILQGWMDAEPCGEKTNCPDNMKYSYGVTSCDSTCRSLSGQENTCQGSFTPVDGCVCPEGTFLNEEDRCVPADQCPCYLDDKVIHPSETISKDGVKCTCNLGKLQCSSQDCEPPMIFFNCSNYEQDQKGLECQSTCEKQDSNNCVSTGCVSGCMCPEGLLADGEGGCVASYECSCTHNGVTYKPMEQVQQDCNTCTCTNGMWICTEVSCYGTCTIYGEGHFKTFDGNRYSYHGDCAHTLAHDSCSMDQSPSFRLVSENKLCESTSTICKSISLFFGIQQPSEIHLSEDGVKVLESSNTEYKYQIHSAGIYIVVEVQGLLNLIWDKKTSVILQLHPNLKGNVCGLCGNFDGNANNDFMKHNGEVVTDPEKFGISWKVKPDCPDVTNIKDLCTENPHRSVWSEKRCSIIISDVFKDCHTLVDPNQYYDDCKRDTCGCETGGDCDCFCTAVAAYAAECRRKGACVKWRSPNTCPLFCDYYNPPGKCEWHYDSCGPPCPKTCKNPTGTCSDQIPFLEGCFPQCPPETPYLLDETMTCVKECYCIYNGKQFTVGSKVYTIEYKEGTCASGVCIENGAIKNITMDCPTTTPSTTTTVPPPSTATEIFISTTPTVTTTTTTPTIPTITTIVTPPSTTPEISTATFTTPTVTTTTPTIPTTTTTVTPPSTTMEMSTTIFTTPTETTTISTKPTTTTPPSTTPEISTVTSTTPTGTTATPTIPTTTTTVTPPSTTTEISTTPTVSTITPTITTTTTPPSTTIEISTATSTTPTVTTTTPTKSTTITPPSTTTETSSTIRTTSTVTITTPTISTTTITLTTPICHWSEWFDNSQPSTDVEGQEIESIKELWQTNKIPCEIPDKIECMSNYGDKNYTGENWNHDQVVSCNTSFGLLCSNLDNAYEACDNHLIRVCCNGSLSTTSSTISTTSTTITPPSTTSVTSTTTSTTPTIPTTSTITPPSTTSVTSTTTSTTPTIPTTSTITPPSTTSVTSTTTFTTPTIPTTSTITPPSKTTVTSTTTFTTPTVTTTTPTIPTTTSPPSTTTELSTVTSTTLTGTTATPTIPTTSTTVRPPSTTTEISTTPTVSTITPTITTTTTPPSTTIEISTTTSTITPPSTTSVTSTTTSTTPTIPTTSTITPPSKTTVTSTTTFTTPTVTTTTPTIPTTTSPPSTTTELSTVTSTTLTGTTATPTIPTTSTTVRPPSTTTEISTATSSTQTVTTTTPTIPTITTLTPPTSTTEISTTISTTSTVTTSTPTISTTTITLTTPICDWSEWFDNSQPSTDVEGQEIESIKDLWETNKIPCEIPDKIECMSNYGDKNYTGENWNHDQVVSCNTSFGLLCSNLDNAYEACDNHLIRVCCNVSLSTTSSTMSTTSTTITPPSTTTETSITTSTTPTVSTTTRTIPTTTTTVTPPSTTTETSTTTTPTVTTTTPTISTAITTTTPSSTTTEISTATSTTPTVTTTTPTIPTTSPPSTTTETSTASSITPTVTTTTRTIPTTTSTVTPPFTTTEISTAASTTYTVTTTTPTIPTTTTRPSTTTEISTATSTTPTVTTTTPTIPTITTSTPPSTTQETYTTTSTTPTVKTTTPTIPTTPTTVTPPSTTTEISTATSTTSKGTTTAPTIPTNTTAVTPPSTTTATTPAFIVYTGPPPTPSPSPMPQQLNTTTTTTTCFCIYNNVKYPAGSTFNLLDKCYSAYCNSSCSVVQQINFDNSTTDACTIKTCKNGTVTSNHVQCDPVVVPKCVNGLGPVKVYYNNRCCYKYECDCLCKAYGDPHYRSFDGQYYTFHGNCTYVLMEEIIPTYNISVHLKNYYCDVVKRIACTQYAIVYYNSYKILLNSTDDKVVHVYVNNQVTIPTYITDRFIITTTGIAATVNITDVNVQITVSATEVSIRLPFSSFRNNTKGQCGCCDNNNTNDCQYPNGTINSLCEKTAAFWNASECTPPPSPPVPPIPPVVPPCEILRSNVFKSCHDVVPFVEYYQACKYDVTTMGNESYGCASVESYAQLCGRKSICVDWRSSPELKGLCDFKCPSTKVYKACGPKVEKSCSTSYNTMYADTQCQSNDCNQTLAEGCYCPDGQYRVNLASNLCTAYCDCIGPDGSPRKPGEIWTYQCYNYTCLNTGVYVKVPVTCPTVNMCGDGYKSAVENCCPTCVCDYEQCLQKKCDVGFELGFNKTEGSCCPPCVQKDVCVYNNTEYKVGVYYFTCQTLNCRQVNGSFVAEMTTTQCPYLSSQDCGSGFEYVKQEGDCCGACVQRNCTYMIENTTYTLQVGEVHSYKCENVTCSAISGSPVTERNSEKCTYLSSLDCKPGFEYVYQEGDCCGTCVQRNCTYMVDETTHTLQVGEVHSFKCENVTCSVISGSPVTERNSEKCTYLSSLDCKLGSEYMIQEGDCCGTCVQKNCTYMMDNTTYTLQVGEVYSYKCENVTCSLISGSPVTERNSEKCTYLSSLDCKLGSEYVIKEGDCCGTCVQRNCTYIMDNTTYTLQVGEVHSYKCENVTCSVSGSPVTERNSEKCTYLSSLDCKPFFEYVKQEGDCCGTCKQTCCIYEAPDNTTHTLKNNEAYTSKCETGTCHEVNGLFETEKTIKQCPPFNPDDCEPGTIKLDSDQCCYTCETRNCVRQRNITRLQVDDCTSVQDLEITSCTGHCGSMYSLYANQMTSCSCCQKDKSTSLPVKLKCTNGTEIDYNYTYIQSCKCTPMKCADKL